MSNEHPNGDPDADAFFPGVFKEKAAEPEKGVGGRRKFIETDQEVNKSTQETAFVLGTVFGLLLLLAGIAWAIRLILAAVGLVELP